MANFRKKYHTGLDAALLGVSLDRDDTRSLHLQLTDQIRQIVRNGLGKPGERLPSSRLLATELSVSRSTVITAVDQLLSEGYLDSRIGAGVFVASDLPHLEEPDESSHAPDQEIFTESYLPFQSGAPDLVNFPYRQWARHLDAAWRMPEPALLIKQDPLGWMPLRLAVADHLHAWRGLRCDAAQIVITSGSAEAFKHIAQILGKSKSVYVESPCYRTMRDQFELAGIDCVFANVDRDGLDPTLLDDAASGIVVTPSRQYPLGVTMPVARRLALLDWAGRANALVVEDDYDSEFRFQGLPPAALASLDQNGRTIYVGSFSKLLSPALRLGYFVVPPSLVTRIRSQLEHAGSQASLTPQPALARFMQSGEFATHVRRMRRLYAKRHQVLTALIHDRLNGFLVPDTQPTGMHIVCQLGAKLNGVLDEDVSCWALAANVHVSPLSKYAQAQPARQGLVLGFAAYDESDLSHAVDSLRAVLISNLEA